MQLNRFRIVFSQSSLSPLQLTGLKKGERDCCFVVQQIYGRFLSISTVAIAIAMIMAMAAATTYVIRSAVVARAKGVMVGAGVGDVATVELTTIADVAAEELP